MTDQQQQLAEAQAEIARLTDEAELRNYEDSSTGEAMTVLFQSLGWSSGGLASAAIEVVQQRDAAHARIVALEEALRDARQAASDYQRIADALALGDKP